MESLLISILLAYYCCLCFQANLFGQLTPFVLLRNSPEGYIYGMVSLEYWLLKEEANKTCKALFIVKLIIEIGRPLSSLDLSRGSSTWYISPSFEGIQRKTKSPDGPEL